VNQRPRVDAACLETPNYNFVAQSESVWVGSYHFLKFRGAAQRRFSTVSSPVWTGKGVMSPDLAQIHQFTGLCMCSGRWETANFESYKTNHLSARKAAL
jgi:hypothetical protein